MFICYYIYYIILTVSLDKVFDVFEDEWIDCTMVNLSEVPAVLVIQIENGWPAEVVVAIGEAASHRCFFSCYYLFWHLFEVRLLGSRGYHILDMIFVNFLVELYGEHAFTGV